MTLEKGDDGLGITVAGYVSPDSTNNGKRMEFCSISFRLEERGERKCRDTSGNLKG